MSSDDFSLLRTAIFMRYKMHNQILIRKIKTERLCTFVSVVGASHALTFCSTFGSIINGHERLIDYGCDNRHFWLSAHN
jgi:hypothetical protein